MYSILESTDDHESNESLDNLSAYLMNLRKKFLDVLQVWANR